jgi:glycerate kinase
MPNSTSAPVVVVAPDSFKGSLSAQAVAQAIGAGVVRARPNAVLRLCPMADGGEGTLDAMLSRGGERRVVRVHGASGAEREAAVGLLPDGSAIVETAEIVGITDEVAMRAAVETRSTRGMGEAIRMLLDEGVRRFFVALGGSSTNDGGAGLLAGLGLKLFDSEGQALDSSPRELARLARVDVSGLDPRLAEASFVGMSDVDNPLTGEHGATAVFGPQKGVAATHIEAIDGVIGRFAALLEAALGRSVQSLPGSGAAGGLGFALRVLGAQFQPGAEVVAAQLGLDAALDGANWLITGEGRSDVQTLHGKAPFIACQHARKANVPATLLSGAVDPAALGRLSDHFNGCFSPAPGPITLDVAMRDAARLLTDKAEQLARFKFGA